MSVKSFRKIVVAVGLSLLVGRSAFASDGRPSQSTLAHMGLGGMVVMSDDEAMSVRGHGYKGGSSALAFGNSFATINTPLGGAHSENGYNSSGKHYAAGGNYSEAGVKISVKNSGKNGKPSYGGKPGGGGYGGGRPPGMGGGGYGGGHGGSSTSITFKVFAGGGSWSRAF